MICPRCMKRELPHGYFECKYCESEKSIARINHRETINALKSDKSLENRVQKVEVLVLELQESISRMAEGKREKRLNACRGGK